MYLKYISVLAIQLKIQTARRTFRVNAKKQDYVNVIVKALDEAKDGKKKYIELGCGEDDRHAASDEHLLQRHEADDGGRR